MTEDEPTDAEHKPERHADRRTDQKPGPPYKDNQGDTVPDDRRIRPDPRLDKMIEVEWEDEETSSPNPENQD